MEELNRYPNNTIINMGCLVWQHNLGYVKSGPHRIDTTKLFIPLEMLLFKLAYKQAHSKNRTRVTINGTKFQVLSCADIYYVLNIKREKVYKIVDIDPIGLIKEIRRRS